MIADPLLATAAILTLGTVTQWAAWKLRVPSILLLLVIGVLVGPIGKILDPDQLLGELLFPLVSLSVAIILFEGGLSLKFREIKGIQGVIFSFISVGMLATWIISALAAYHLLELSFPIAILLGSILTVSGPTVVIPMLRQVRAREPLGTILKWEGILIDPVGALLAVLVLEAVLAGHLVDAPELVLFHWLRTALIGTCVGVLGAIAIGYPMKKFWIPDYLKNPLAFTAVVLAFAVSELLHHESGLFAVTVMGIMLSNWRDLNTEELLEFKSDLQALLLPSLFIILSARLPTEHLEKLDFGALIFLVVLIFVARPVSTILATSFSGLKVRERIMLALLAPRGIVAAAVASLFAIELVEAGHAEGELFATYVFFVIFGTIVVYSFLAPLGAKLLGLQRDKPQGLLVCGAQRLSREIAKVLKENGVKVALVDTNWQNVTAARQAGIPCAFGNIALDRTAAQLDLDGIGKYLGSTANDEANSLGALRFQELFGSSQVYQLSSSPIENGGRISSELPSQLRGRILFGSKWNYDAISTFYSQGAIPKLTTITEQFSFEDLLEARGDSIIPLFVLDEGKVEVFTAEGRPNIRPGASVLSLVIEP